VEVYACVYHDEVDVGICSEGVGVAIGFYVLGKVECRLCCFGSGDGAVEEGEELIVFLPVGREAVRKVCIGGPGYFCGGREPDKGDTNWRHTG
jgi:hypothetical protein